MWNISLRVANTDVKLNDCVKLLGVYIDYEPQLSSRITLTISANVRQGYSVPYEELQNT